MLKIAQLTISFKLKAEHFGYAYTGCRCRNLIMAYEPPTKENVKIKQESTKNTATVVFGFSLYISEI